MDDELCDVALVPGLSGEFFCPMECEGELVVHERFSRELSWLLREEVEVFFCPVCGQTFVYEDVPIPGDDG